MRIFQAQQLLIIISNFSNLEVMRNAQAFKLDSPYDTNYDINSVNMSKLGMKNDISPCQDQKQIKKKKKNKNGGQQQINSILRRKPNYFQKMYREAEKKMYVNIFIRKLKQLIPRYQNFSHPLCEQEGNMSQRRLIPTILLKPQLETPLSIFFIVITLLSCIHSTLVLVFPEIQDTVLYCIISALTLISALIQFSKTIFTRSSININNQKSEHFLFAKEAALHYFSTGWMGVDFCIICFFFFDIFINSQTLKFLKLIVLAKIIFMVNKIRNLQILLIRHCFREQFWELVKVFAFNFIFAHFIATILLLMANPSNSWLTKKQINNSPWPEQYIWAYYWATTVMLTVGFGDLTPVNIQQATVMIFIESLSCIVLAYNIANVSKIINKITSYEMEKVQNLKIFTQMQSKEPVSQDIRKKITNYIIQSSQIKRNFNINEQNQLVRKLPKTFYEQLKKQSTFKIFGSVPFFRNLKTSKLQQLAVKIQKKLTHPEQILVESGSTPQILILNSGQISYNMNRVGLKSHGKQIQTFKIKENQYRILSMYFFIRKNINYDVKCKDYTILYTISQKQLQTLLSTNPYCYEYYCMCRDKDRFNACDWQIQKCELCKNNDRHSYFECPKLHFVPMKNMIVAKALQNSSFKLKLQFSGRRRRLPRNSVNALRYYSDIQQIFKSIQISQKVKDFIKRSKKNKKGITWGKINTIGHNPTIEPSLVRDEKIRQLQNISSDLESQYVRFQSLHPNIQDKTSIAKMKKKDGIRQLQTDEEDKSLVVQCCHKSTVELATMMKVHYLKEFTKKKQSKQILFSDVCRALTDKIKDEIVKTNFTNSNNVQGGWDVDLDVAHDYPFYFQNDNPAMMRKRWKKRKNYGKQIKQMLQNKDQLMTPHVHYDLELKK